MTGIIHIIIKEFRQRSRGLATLALIFFYSLGLTAIVFLTIIARLNSFIGSRFEFAEVGRNITILLYFVQLFVSVLFSLSFTATTIASERDQSTFETLNLTRFTNFEILAGKLLSAFLFNLMLLITALPLYTIAFIFGGVEPNLISTAITLLITTSFLTSVLGLLVSLTSADVRTAMARGFLILIALGVITSVSGFLTFQAIASATAQNKFLKILGMFSMLFNPIFPLFNALKANTLLNITPDWGTLYQIISPNATSSFNLFGWQLLDINLTTSSALMQIWGAFILFSVALAIYPIYRSRRFM